MDAKTLAVCARVNALECARLNVQDARYHVELIVVFRVVLAVQAIHPHVPDVHLDAFHVQDAQKHVQVHVQDVIQHAIQDAMVVFRRMLQRIAVQKTTVPQDVEISHPAHLL